MNTSSTMLSKETFSRQKGFGPIFSFSLGLLIAAFFLLGFLINLVTFTLSLFQSVDLRFVNPAGIVRIIVYLLVFLLLAYIGYILMALFPAIKVTQAGVEYKTLIFVDRVTWEDIEKIIEIPGPYHATGLVFWRKHQNPFRFMADNFLRSYPNHTHGLLTGAREPVIVLSEGLENRDEILDEIKKHLPAARIPQRPGKKINSER